MSSSTPASGTESARPDFESLSVEAASIVTQRTAWQRVKANVSVRIGGGVIALLVLIALFAPWLGTVDPSLFDPASRDLRPGQVGEITTLEGETLKHRFLMGSDSFGRDIHSRVIYGTQVSLIVMMAFTAVSTMARLWRSDVSRASRAASSSVTSRPTHKMPAIRPSPSLMSECTHST